MSPICGTVVIASVVGGTGAGDVNGVDAAEYPGVRPNSSESIKEDTDDGGDELGRDEELLSGEPPYGVKLAGRSVVDTLLEVKRLLMSLLRGRLVSCICRRSSAFKYGCGGAVVVGSVWGL